MSKALKSLVIGYLDLFSWCLSPVSKDLMQCDKPGLLKGREMDRFFHWDEEPFRPGGLAQPFCWTRNDGSQKQHDRLTGPISYLGNIDGQ